MLITFNDFKHFCEIQNYLEKVCHGQQSKIIILTNSKNSIENLKTEKYLAIGNEISIVVWFDFIIIYDFPFISMFFFFFFLSRPDSFTG